MESDPHAGWRREPVTLLAPASAEPEVISALVVDGELAAGPCRLPGGEPGVVLVARSPGGEPVAWLFPTTLAEELRQHLRQVIDEQLRAQWAPR